MNEFNSRIAIERHETYEVLIKGSFKTLSLNVYLILRKESLVTGVLISISNSKEPSVAAFSPDASNNTSFVS